MRAIYKIAKSELGSLFYSPIAWLILIIFTIQIYTGFSSMLEYYANAEMMGYTRGGVTISLFLTGVNAPFLTMQSNLFLYIPLLTMGLMSKEYSSGSIKLLFSSPISSSQIILGKFLAMMIFGLVFICIIFIPAIYSSFIVKNFDWAYVLSGLLGLYLLTCTYMSIGLFMSTLTSYQIVAALGTLTFISFLNFIGNLWQNVEIIREIMQWFSLVGHSQEAIRGLICSEDILYFILVSGMFIGLSILKLQFSRRSCSIGLRIGKYAGLIVLVCLLGYISSRPALMSFYDATEHQQRTLTPNSQKILEQVDGDLTITAYVNLFDEFSYLAMPGNWANDNYLFSQFIRFKPEIKMEYVYFYDNIDGSQYSEAEMKEKVEKILITSDINPKKVLSPRQIREKIDLSAENNHFVRVLERENGQKAFLRIFNDQNRNPSEAEISAVLKTMVTHSPHIAFISGHGERDIYHSNDFNYVSYTTSLRSRDALLNQGYTPYSLLLNDNGEIPQDVDVLVIADPRKAFSSDEIEQIQRFIERGGNLVIAGEARREQLVNPLLELLGLRLNSGMLVQPKADYATELIATTFTPEAQQLEKRFKRSMEIEARVFMPTATSIEVIEDKGFTVIPFLTTPDGGCWNELEAYNFLEAAPVLNESKGEEEKAYSTAIALTRQVNGKEQRIVVLGDADCMSDGELSVMRNIRAGNYSLVFGMYQWLVYDEYPIDISRPELTDDKVYITPDTFKWVKLFFVWICPILLLIGGCVLWFRRQMK